MKSEFLTGPGGERLIILFLGWGMDPSPFRQLRKPGYDILAVWDYRDRRFPVALTEGYREIVVVAWSFGVRIAAGFLAENRGLPITRRIAVNGTQWHVDDTRGIPHAIFEGTLAALSDVTLRKFNRRMFCSKADYERFALVAPSRGIDELREELQMFGSLSPLEADAGWTNVIVGGRDAIIPPANQTEAWGGNVELLPDMGHFPPFDVIIDKYVIDKQLVAERFSRASGSYGNNAVAQKCAALKLWKIARPFVTSRLDCGKTGSVLEVGVGSGLLTSVYLADVTPERLLLWDIAETAAETCPPGAVFECCDAETSIASLPEQSIDVLISSSTLQWFNSPAAFLTRAAAVLKPGALVVVSFYQEGTFREVAEATGVGLRYPSVARLLKAVEDTYQVMACVDDTIVEEFPSVAEAVRRVKLTGVNAVSRERTAAFRLLRNYPSRPDGSATLTYRPVYLVMKKR